MRASFILAAALFAAVPAVPAFAADDYEGDTEPCDDKEEGDDCEDTDGDEGTCQEQEDGDLVCDVDPSDDPDIEGGDKDTDVNADDVNVGCSSATTAGGAFAALSLLTLLARRRR